MPPALVSSVIIDGGEHGGVTSSAIDTSGATLLVVKVAWRDTATPAPTDNKGNTFTPLTSYDAELLSASGRLYYCANPTVGTGHTFTLPNVNNSWCSAVVAAFSGVATVSPFDVENGNGIKATGTTILPGSITPSQDGSLVVSGLQHTNGDLVGYPITIDSSFIKIAETATDVVIQRGAALAYKVQGTAAAENPTWTDPWAGARMVATIAAFDAAGASGIVDENYLHYPRTQDTIRRVRVFS